MASFATLPPSSPVLANAEWVYPPASKSSRISSDSRFCTRSAVRFNNRVCLGWNVGAVVEFWWMPGFELESISCYTGITTTTVSISSFSSFIVDLFKFV